MRYKLTRSTYCNGVLKIDSRKPLQAFKIYGSCNVNCMNRNANQFSPCDLPWNLSISIYKRESPLSRVHRCIFTMTKLAASRRGRLRPARGYRRTIPIEMRIRMSTMAGTFIPPSRLPSCERFADSHLKLKSRVLAWASYAALHHVRSRLSTHSFFYFVLPRPVPLDPSFFPVIHSHCSCEPREYA